MVGGQEDMLVDIALSAPVVHGNSARTLDC
jgi:hypothetical protein